MRGRFPLGTRPEREIRVPSFIRGPLWVVYHKKHLYVSHLTSAKLWNLVKLLRAYLLKKPVVGAYPVILKVDVTPLCQLRCGICIHARSFEPKQSFHPGMKMSMGLFRKLCDEVGGKTIVLSLHYLGEPLLHEDLPEMIRYAARKGLNTYFTTNFSLKLSESYLADLVGSGLGTLIVALDGYSQESYGQTRMGGDIERVKDNLRRFLSIRNRLGQRRPYVIVQSLLFPHNLHEQAAVEEFCRRIGVDSIAFAKGDLVPWSEQYRPRTRPKPKGRLPHCLWPYFSGVVLFDGDVIPCCFYRVEAMYAEGLPRIAMGNMEENTLEEIFNSRPYQIARRLSYRPSVDEEARGNFCFGCRYLFV